MTLLYDQFGKKIQSQKPILQQVAVQSIRDRYSEYPSHGLTPGRLAAILKEADQGYIIRQAELMEEMEEKDLHLGSELQKRRLAVAGLKWEVLPASDDPQDKTIADEARTMIGNIENFEEKIFDMLDAIGKGFSVMEIMWDISEGQVAIKDLEWIHQKRFTFSGPQQQVGSETIWPLLSVPRILTDAEMIYGEELLPNKFIYHRHKSRSGYPSRGGLIRACAYMYLFKNYDIKDWLTFNDLFSVPMRVGKYKSGANDKDIEALKQAVFNLGVDAAAVISDSTIIELLEAATRTNSGGFKELADFCDDAMSKGILGHAGSSHGTKGSLGGIDKTVQEVRQDILEFDAKVVSSPLRSQALGPWVMYNFGPGRKPPKLRLHAEADEDLKSVADTYGVLIQAGFDQIPVSHIQDRFDIPKPVDGEPTVKAAAPASPFNFGALPSPPAPISKPAAQVNKFCACGAQHHKTPSASPRPRAKKAVDVNLQLMINKVSGDDAAWIDEYMQRLQPALQGAKQSALDEIKIWLEAQETPPTSAEFIAKIQEILGNAYSNMDPNAVNSAVGDMYKYYKQATPLVNASVEFGGADISAVNWLSNADNMFYGKMFTNPDAQASISDFLEQQYLKNGTGLFGRGDPSVIEEFQNLLSQQVGETSAYQAQRIADTSVQRIRSFSQIQQFSDAAIPTVKIVEPTEECDFCRAMNGQEISVDDAAGLMQDLIGKTAEEFLSWLQGNPASLDNINSLVNSGALPPYHPNCHGFFTAA
jgi:phage gp29-like protein